MNSQPDELLDTAKDMVNAVWMELKDLNPSPEIAAKIRTVTMLVGREHIEAAEFLQHSSYIAEVVKYLKSDNTTVLSAEVKMKLNHLVFQYVLPLLNKTIQDTQTNLQSLETLKSEFEQKEA